MPFVSLFFAAYSLYDFIAHFKHHPLPCRIYDARAALWPLSEMGEAVQTPPTDPAEVPEDLLLEAHMWKKYLHEKAQIKRKTSTPYRHRERRRKLAARPAGVRCGKSPAMDLCATTAKQVTATLPGTCWKRWMRMRKSRCGLRCACSRIKRGYIASLLILPRLLTRHQRQPSF